MTCELMAPFQPQVEWLSGGEKARLALAKFMLTQVGGWGVGVWRGGVVTGGRVGVHRQPAIQR